MLSPSHSPDRAPPSPAESLAASLERELDVLQRAGLRRTLTCVQQRRGVAAVVEGQAVVDFSSNDYLGLASDPRLARAAEHFLEHEAFGAGAAHSIAGHHPVHETLERQIALLKHSEAALLFSSGFAANVGAITALVGREDIVYSDSLNHASIIDACRLCRGTTARFAHGDLDALERQLGATAGKYRRRIIVVEGVYSMDGDLCPLNELVELAGRFDAWVYLDDAHGTGVLGAHGGGAAELWGVEDKVAITVATLGKAFGAAGGAVAGPAVLRDFLLNRARSFIFTTASPPVLAAAALEGIWLAQQEPWRRQRLLLNAQHLRDSLGSIDISPPPPGPGHITPVIIGDAERTLRIARRLRASGFLVGAIRPPSVPLGTARLRITVSASHTTREIDDLLVALTDALRLE